MSFITTPPYWEYFRALESDLAATNRWVDMGPDNFKTYSIEFARILIAAGSEIDSVLKRLCREIAPQERPRSIDKYMPIVTDRYKRFSEFEINIPRFALRTFKPWELWGQKKTPLWWKPAFTDVKHNRHEHFVRANLGNCIHAVGALLIVLYYYYDASNPMMPIMDVSARPVLYSTKGEAFGPGTWHPTIK